MQKPHKQMKIISSIYFKIFSLFLSAIVIAILLAYEIDKNLHNSEISRSKSEILYLIGSMTPNIVMEDFNNAQNLMEQFGFYTLENLPNNYHKLQESTNDAVYSMIFNTKETIGFELEYSKYHAIASRPITYSVGNNFLLFFGFFVGILAVLGILVLRLLYPLRRLKKSLKSFTSQIQHLNHTSQISTEQNDEISGLIASFNMMSEQIMRMLKGRELILKSLGHELKTPLTKMRLFIEVSQKEYPYMEKLLPYVSSLKQLIDNILELERLNSGKIQLESNRFFAETLVFETLKGFSEAQEQIQLEIKENFALQGDLELLARALRNLIENGLKYNEAPYIKIIIGDEICAQNAKIEQSNPKEQQLMQNDEKPSMLLGWGSRNYTLDLELESVSDSFSLPELQKAMKEKSLSPLPKCISIISKSPPLTHPLHHYTEPFVRDDTHNALPGHGLGLSIVSDILALHGYALQYSYHKQRHYFSMVFTTPKSTK